MALGLERVEAFFVPGLDGAGTKPTVSQAPDSPLMPGPGLGNGGHLTPHGHGPPGSLATFFEEGLVESAGAIHVTPPQPSLVDSPRTQGRPGSLRAAPAGGERVDGGSEAAAAAARDEE